LDRGAGAGCADGTDHTIASIDHSTPGQISGLRRIGVDRTRPGRERSRRAVRPSASERPADPRRRNSSDAPPIGCATTAFSPDATRRER